MESTAAVKSDWADEREVIEALRRRDQDAFTALVERHEALMHRVASMYVRSPAVAQEVVQDTWLSVLNGIDSFQSRSSLKTWIFRILVNSAKTRGARERRTVPFSSLTAAGSDEPFDADRFADDSLRPGGTEGRPAHPEQRVLSREAIGEAVRAIDSLPDSQRQVIAMRDLHGCSSEEVCSALGISGGNQRVQLHRARAKVRRELTHYFNPALQPS
jgi:RNA polymerase sigma-70 factor (ECF subfamily)